MASGKLNALKVRNLTTPGRYGDGDGLWFQVRDADQRSWLLRFMFDGKGRWMGLGPYPDVSLGEARDEAAKGRRLIRQGIDPIEARRRERSKRRATAVPTFRKLAEDYLAAHEIAWTNPKHRYQWRQTLMEAADRFGEISVAEIDTAAVLKVIEPIGGTRPKPPEGCEAGSSRSWIMPKCMGGATAKTQRVGAATCPSCCRRRTKSPVSCITRRCRGGTSARSWPNSGDRCGRRVRAALDNSDRREDRRDDRRTVSEIDRERAVWIIPARV